MNPDTLESIKRTNMDLDNIQKVMELSREYGIGTYSELILGLPLETLESWKNGLCNLLESGQHDSIDVWFAQLLENSELADSKTREKYNIQSIVAKDYMSMQNYNYWDDIPETIEIVNATSTMTTDDIVEAYMYAWTVVHFHITGYSQIYSKYLRNVNGIDYRNFYDKLYNEISTNKNNFFNEHFVELKQVVATYLKTGELNSSQYKGHNLLSKSAEYFYINKQFVYDTAEKIFNHYSKIDDSLKTLQRNILFDERKDYPIVVNIEYNTLSWKKNPTTVTIDSRIKDYKSYNFYSMRRQNLIRNIIEVT